MNVIKVLFFSDLIYLSKYNYFNNRQIKIQITDIIYAF